MFKFVFIDYVPTELLGPIALLIISLDYMSYLG